MSWIRRLGIAKATPRASLPRRAAGAEEKRRLVDAIFESYVCWREQCVDVQSAYDRWIAGDDQRGHAFAIYHAELEFEERAARAYRECTERLALATGRRALTES
jgi:hypothetical protein